MAEDVPSTNVHREPVRRAGGRLRPALVCAFPRPMAVALPDSGTVIGRGWLADHGLEDTEVSNAHLRIDRAGGAMRIADVSSRNGTWVDGSRLSASDLVPLTDGAVLRLGRTIFVVREGLLGSFDPADPLGALVGPFGLRAVAEAVDGLAGTHAGNVLVEGETGAGKELVARAVAAKLRRQSPFAAVNVAGVSAGVFESQLFGHVAGAFSGARAGTPGIVLAHDGGTVLLDEIGELGLELQAKLLRLLDNRELLPVGADRPRPVDVLIITATNRPLAQMVEAGTFRRDLFMRLAQARIELPPLRKRSEDVFAVATALTGRAGATLPLAQVEVEAVERLMLEPWPGNVRELDSCLAAARRLDPAPGLRLWTLEHSLGARDATGGALTHQRVEAALRDANGNVTAAARQLGVTRGKLLRLLKRSS